jgi:hypothetical protein
MDTTKGPRKTRTDATLDLDGRSERCESAWRTTASLPGEVAACGDSGAHGAEVPITP